MNLHKLLTLQRELDARIKAEHGLHGQDLVPKKLLALQVELAELANETRCFKFWSKKPASGLDIILEEYVDVLHFALSLALELGYTDLQPAAAAPADSVTASFLELMDRSSRLAATRAQGDLEALLAGLLGLGGQLGLQAGDIEAAYLAKNEVNHQRQAQGY
ncbi:dUTP diphosphatase [Tumebacillus sp. BK434]|uniref:dUTP diphosphatase n=1 Tax=Tumebacillus sp. BK434 TaxID=2512169 RepID=UPI00104DAD5C|nr:dUTP diphosphatase [Tumebacillus sp. BK434]